MTKLKKEGGCEPPSWKRPIRYPLLAEMPQPVFANERRAGPANEAVVVTIAIRPVVAVIGVSVIAERCRRDCARRSDRSTHYAGREITRPEVVVPIIHACVCALLLELNWFRSRMRIRQGR